MKEELEATRKRMLDYLAEEGKVPLNKDLIVDMREYVGFMIDDAIAAIPEDVPERVSEEQQEKVLASLKKLECIYWESEFDQNFSAFGQDYTILIFNWNRNLADNPDIESLSILLTKLFSMKMTIEQLLMACKHLMSRIRQNRDYIIPASNLSRNYFEKLLGDKTENCE